MHATFNNFKATTLMHTYTHTYMMQRKLHKVYCWKNFETLSKTLGKNQFTTYVVLLKDIKTV